MIFCEKHQYNMCKYNYILKNTEQVDRELINTVR